ncbi:MAG TPA: type II toxin-antitoxin system Phd/YefM family antitoxin [Tepidisphaeraceae bacterium]|nr:type II toxin-antitoxin system Phd/YefM family antitoxin [Tepidisphaeraceae bacterium]
MKIASVADVKAKLSAYVKASDSGPVVITRNGKAVAAIVGLANDDDVERLLLAFSTKLRGILLNAKKRIRSGRGIPHDEFWRQMSAEKAKRKSA